MYVSVEFDSIEISPITGFRDDLMDSVIVKSQIAKRQWSVDYSLEDSLENMTSTSIDRLFPIIFHR